MLNGNNVEKNPIFVSNSLRPELEPPNLSNSSILLLSSIRRDREKIRPTQCRRGDPKSLHLKKLGGSAFLQQKNVQSNQQFYKNVKKNAVYQSNFMLTAF